jgi:hypothetical protein
MLQIATDRQFENSARTQRQRIPCASLTLLGGGRSDFLLSYFVLRFQPILDVMAGFLPTEQEQFVRARADFVQDFG